MNISIVNESLEYHNIERLSKFKAGLKVEVFVFISSLIILITTVPIVRYKYDDKFLSSLILYYDTMRALHSFKHTFINFMVLLDCLNSLGHIPTLFQLI